MSASVWAVVVSATACLLILAALIKGLVERLKGLAGSLRKMQEKVQPLANVVISEGRVAQERLDQLNRSTEVLRRAGSPRTPVSAVAGATTADPEPGP